MNKRWSSNPKPVKLGALDKTRLEAVVKQYIEASSELSEVINRIEIKAGRIYLYRLHEQFGWDNPDVQFIKPLIDGKYAEFPMARITLFDTQGKLCEVDWQRHTGQWMNLYEGDIAGSLAFIEENDQWFQ
ncbi:hypothetical protein L1N85_21440 [Paenibacillus alkaliterrae]|uniref:hypothetical protein n=1 Tax=Paenibacillus alkaliterrae TaxID=320909 RepID=UPI001F200ADC|nr:hypothetical protein [Paenibacillus alkaliterrae]MCF2940954.1 hypothetical protein [Paenibacillus alkaliterrae]